MITVSQNGTGDYTTIADAIDSIPADNQSRVTILVKPGIYKENLTIDKPYISLIGESAKDTIITYDNYAKMMMDDGIKRGTFRSYSVFIDTHDFYSENITYENSSGLGRDVGQALALYVDGDNIQFNRCIFLASQDTLFTGPLPPAAIEKNGFIGPKEFDERINGRHYYNNCYIRGDIDFIFGSATAYFENCELFSQNIDSEVNGYVTAASTAKDQAYGYVFEKCHFTSNCPEGSVYLGRPWRNFAKTVLLNCELDAHINKAGWHDWNKSDAHDTVFYAEYNSTGAGASNNTRPSWVHILSSDEIDIYSRERVLGSDFRYENK